MQRQIFPYIYISHLFKKIIQLWCLMEMASPQIFMFEVWVTKCIGYTPERLPVKMDCGLESSYSYTWPWCFHPLLNFMSTLWNGKKSDIYSTKAAQSRLTIITAHPSTRFCDSRFFLARSFFFHNPVDKQIKLLGGNTQTLYLLISTWATVPQTWNFVAWQVTYCT